MSNSCCHSESVGERDAGTGLAGGLDVEHLRGQVDDRGLGGGLLADPGLAADAGQGRTTLGSAHILLDQPDPHGRDVDLGAAVEFDLQMLFRPAVLLDLSQASIATDAVRQVHDQVSFAQFEKAVDRLSQAAAGSPPQLAALKQLGAADQNHPLADQAKSFVECADEQVQTTGLRDGRGGEDLAESLAFRVGLGDQEHVVVGAAVIEFIPDLGDVTAESLHRFDLQAARRSESGLGDRRGRGQRELPEGSRCTSLGDANPRGRFQTREVAFGFGQRLVGLHEQEPGVGRQVVGQRRLAVRGRAAAR